MAGRVAVVGATGQIGRPLCRELALAGHAVSVFSRDPARARRAGGRGWTPWIHITDEVGLIAFALRRPDIDGPVNRFPDLDPALRDIIDGESVP